jgi:hypothetical protein
MKTLITALVLVLVTASLAEAGNRRCRTSKSGSVTYVTCEVAVNPRRPAAAAAWAQ